jgi:hypothetical protein
MLSAFWDAARGWWAGLSNEQRVYVAVVGVVLLLLAPRILVLTVLLLERLLIGSLLAAEEAALAALVKGGSLVSVHTVCVESAHWVESLGERAPSSDRVPHVCLHGTDCWGQLSRTWMHCMAAPSICNAYHACLQ